MLFVCWNEATCTGARIGAENHILAELTVTCCPHRANDICHLSLYSSNKVGGRPNCGRKHLGSPCAAKATVLSSEERLWDEDRLACVAFGAQEGHLSSQRETMEVQHYGS